MSKEPWNKCPLTGISKKALGHTDYANHQGELKTELFPDCTLYDVSSIAYAAGYSRPDNFKRAVRTDTSSSMHLHRIINDDGETMSYCTHVSSAEWGGKKLRTSGKERQQLGKKITDVSGGAG